MIDTTQAAPPAPTRHRASSPQPSVLFDAPGPLARRRNNMITAIFIVVLLALVYLVVGRLAREGQFEARLWSPFIEAQVWADFILPGLVGTVKATIPASVLALLFGVVFGFGRLSDHRWIRVPSGMIVEFFRAIPLLLLIFFVFTGPAQIANAFNREFPQISALSALVIGLMLYNGSVLAELFRAGIQSIPRGQSEAAYALGLRKGRVMRLVLLPQAVTAMMPAIVAQLVVLLKDSALGWIIAYPDLLNYGFRIIPGNYGNIIPAAVVIALIYIPMNMSLSHLAHVLERRTRRNRRSAAAIITGAPIRAPRHKRP
jgi:glutamate transport system permease protein